jgi:hypothetical protein
VIVFEQYAVADCAVDKNMATGKDWSKNNVPVKITQIGLTGANAVAEMEVDIYYGTTKIANFHNTATGLEVQKINRFWVSSKKTCKKGERINIEVISAPTVSPVMLFLNLAEVRSTGYRRSYQRRY